MPRSRRRRKATSLIVLELALLALAAGAVIGLYWLAMWLLNS